MAKKTKINTAETGCNYMTVTCTTEEIMEFLGVEQATVYNWRAAGMPGDDGRWPLYLVAKWRIDRLLKELEEAKRGDATLYKLKQEYQKKVIVLKELEIQKNTGRLVDAQQVRGAWNGEMRMISRKVQSLVYRLNALLNGDAKMLELIRQEVDTLREDIVQTEFSMKGEDDDPEEVIEEELSEEEMELGSDEDDDAR